MKKAAIYNLTWDSLGGGERYAAAFAKVLEETGNYSIDIWWPKDIRRSINQRFDIDLKSANFIPNPLIKSSFWQRLAVTSNYDLIFWISDGSVPLSLSKKTILHFQIPFHSPGAKAFTNKLKARFYISICNSYFTKEVIDKTYSISSQVIYPPVDTQFFTRGQKENLIVSVGRLSQLMHAKRQDILIDAFAKLHKILPDWKLVLAGGSQDIEYYKALLTQASGLPIKIIANPTLPQIKDLFARAKIFWAATGFGVDVRKDPEKTEHFGITPVEAMASGAVPVITAAGGHEETVLPGRTGYLWKSIDELVDFSLELAENYRKWGIMSRKGELRSKIFDRAVFVEKYLNLI